LNEYLQSFNTAILTSQTFANTVLNTQVYGDNFVFAINCEKVCTLYGTKQLNSILGHENYFTIEIDTAEILS